MKGDFTRSTFQRQKHYTSVRMQQGRLQLDSDWNEQADIQNYLRQSQVVDMVGSDSGAPSVNPATGQPTRNSFRVVVVALSNPPKDNEPSDLALIPGHFYANGVLCELETGSSFPARLVKDKPKTVTVDSLIIDGQKLAIGQWLELAGENDSASIASSNAQIANETTAIRGLQIVSIDEKRRELTVNGTLSESETPSESEQTDTVKLRRLLTYRTQADYPILARSPLGVGDYLAYLDVWERHITVIEDQEIRETALNVPDTATRTKTVWQLKLQPISPSTGGQELAPETEWKNYVRDRQSRQALMNACARLCSNGQNGRVSSLDNQLYRVEIHQAGKTPQEPLDPKTGKALELQAGKTPNPQTPTTPTKPSQAIATFKWSRDNGSTASAIDRIEKNVIRIQATSEDAWASSTPGQWIEITSEANELKAEPGVMVPLIRAIDNKLEFDESQMINGPIPPNAKTVRRWDYTTIQAAQGSIPIQNEWVELEAGIRVKFDPDSSYETGDYWMIPARSGPSDIEWPNDQAVPNPQPLAQPRRGIAHQYALLATVKVESADLFSSDDLQDQRLVFPPLTRCLDRAGGTIEGDLEIQGHLSVTQRQETSDAGTKTIIGNLGVGIKEAAARFHVQAAEAQTGPIVRVDNASGTQQLTMLANGKVGIGTPDPQTELDINGKTRTQDLEVTGTFAANLFQGQTFEIVKNPTSNASERYGLIRVGTDDFPRRIEFGVNLATTFAFVSGKVGVGAVNLASQFGVSGNVAIGSTAYLNSGSIPANGLVVEGSVGIGTSTPDQQFKLSVNGNVKVENNLQATTLQANSLTNRNSQALRLQTANSDRLVIAPTGNIGIGTEPIDAAKLVVQGNLQTNGGNLEINGGNLQINGEILGDRLTLSAQTGNTRFGPAPLSAPPPEAKLVIHDGLLRVSRTVGSEDKYVQIGRRPEPGLEFCNYETNCPRHYFNQPVTIDGDLIVEQDLEIKGKLKGDVEIEGQLQNLAVTGQIQSDRLVASSLQSLSGGDLRLRTGNQLGIFIAKNTGNVLIGVESVPPSAPPSASTAKLYVNGAIFGQQVGGTDIVQLSSQTLKQDITQMSSQEAAVLLEQLRPVKFAYQDDETNATRAGFLAEETPDLLTSADQKAIRILDVVAVLTRSLKDQQKTVADLLKVVQAQDQAIVLLRNQVSTLEQQNITQAVNSNAIRSQPFSYIPTQPKTTPQTEPESPFQTLTSPAISDRPRANSRTRRTPQWTRWPLIRQVRKLFAWLLSHRTKRRLQRSQFH